MTTLNVGIASHDEMKSRTMRIARGKQRVVPSEPRVVHVDGVVREGAVGGQSGFVTGDRRGAAGLA